MTADDRRSSASNLVRPNDAAARSHQATQSATFDLGDLSLELTASPGTARLTVIAGTVRDIYVIDPAALAEWSRAIERLLSIPAASTDRERAEYRSPFLFDREGRASIAAEALVGTRVAFRLIVHGAESRVVGAVTTAETIRGLADAAAGLVAIARAEP